MSNVLKIDGAAIAQNSIDALKKRPRPKKTLAAILIGNDHASLTFVRRKSRVARELGIAFDFFQFSATDTEDTVRERIRDLSRDERVGGIVLQLPLPARFDRDALIAAIALRKDVDNVTGCLVVESPAVGVVKEILAAVSRSHNIKFKSLDGLIVAVVGKGFLVGAPISKWLERASASVSPFTFKAADIDTADIRGFVADADLIITGVGKAGLIDPRWLKDGAGVIDFGFPPDFTRETSHGARPYDVTILNHLAFYTPTPGGTGPILVAKLFENFYSLNCG